MVNAKKHIILLLLLYATALKSMENIKITEKTEDESEQINKPIRLAAIKEMYKGHFSLVTYPEIKLTAPQTLKEQCSESIVDLTLTSPESWKDILKKSSPAVFEIILNNFKLYRRFRASALFGHDFRPSKKDCPISLSPQQKHYNTAKTNGGLTVSIDSGKIILDNNGVELQAEFNYGKRLNRVIITEDPILIWSYEQLSEETPNISSSLYCFDIDLNLLQHFTLHPRGSLEYIRRLNISSCNLHDLNISSNGDTVTSYHTPGVKIERDLSNFIETVKGATRLTYSDFIDFTQNLTTNKNQNLWDKNKKLFQKITNKKRKKTTNPSNKTKKQKTFHTDKED